MLTARAFWFLRHGETDWNARGLSQGNVDVALNANGLAQAEAAAGLLRGRGIGAIFSSTLSRARVTAQIVGAALDVPVTLDHELRETAFGVQEGHAMSEWFAEWVEERATPEGAETFATLRARAVAAVNRALDQPATALIVSHGAFFRALRSAMGLAPNVRLPNAAPMLCVPPGHDDDAWSLVAATRT